MKLKSMIFKQKHQPLTLIRTILVRIFLLSLSAVVLFTGISYHMVYETQKEKRLEELQAYVLERVRTDSEIFKLAEDNLKAFEKEYLTLYLSDTNISEDEFNSYYFVDNEGATRMKREYFDGIYDKAGNYVYGMSSFIGNNQKVEPELQRRLILAYRVIYRLGPAWINRFANLHAAFPENAITLFYPDEPWGLVAKADLPMNELGVIKAVSMDSNPDRKSIWSGLYYDETAQTWTVTYMDPIDYNGRHLITPGHDVYLSDLMERLIKDTGDGTYNFIIRKDGYLVAHPSNPTDDQKWVGQLSLDKITIPSVKEAYRLIQEQGVAAGEVEIIQNKAYDSYLAVGELQGPDWLFVRVFPMDIVRSSAHTMALSVFTDSMIMLVVILLIIRYVIRNQAEHPLKQLSHAAESIGRGHYDQVAQQTPPLPVELKNEIGLLSKRFVEMATNIKDSQETLERIVEERTRALEKANEKLTELSLMDGLTGIHNRRAFDRDIARIFEDAQKGLGTFSLMMLDIDYFKNYNDAYGHAEGDKVLKAVALTIAGIIRKEDRIYRYGGEEFIIIFCHAQIAAASEIAARMLQGVRDLNIAHCDCPQKIVTVSGGIVEYGSHFMFTEQIIHAADQKMYMAKHTGRDTFII